MVFNFLNKLKNIGQLVESEKNSKFKIKIFEHAWKFK